MAANVMQDRPDAEVLRPAREPADPEWRTPSRVGPPGHDPRRRVEACAGAEPGRSR